MSSLMYDSAAGHFPEGAHAVALYANGLYRYTGPDFPETTRVLWIDVLGNDPAAASILDIEQGDVTPAHVPGWCRARLAAVPNSLLRLYCNLSTWPAVIAEVHQLHPIERQRVRYWIASPLGFEHMIPGASATQWSWGPDGGWDTSTTGADW
jgi:hypothetical protein